MSGALKHFFDTIYHLCMDATGDALGLVVHGNDDTAGAVICDETGRRADVAAGRRWCPWWGSRTPDPRHRARCRCHCSARRCADVTE